MIEARNSSIVSRRSRRPREVRAVGARREQRKQQQVEGELLVRDACSRFTPSGGVLQQRLALEDLAGGRASARALPVRPGDAGDVHARGLADEVVVGRRVQREVPGDELGVLVDRFQPAVAEARSVLAAKSGASTPPSSCQANAQLVTRSPAFERARPLRPMRNGHASHQLSRCEPYRPRSISVGGEHVGLRERHQVQVAIGLPQVLAVADQRRIAIVELLAEGERRLDAGLGIAVPARRVAEVRRLHREEVEAAREDALRRGHVRRGIEPRLAIDPRLARAREVRRRHTVRANPSLGAHRPRP
jgi:hypothetical protein